uniref:GPR158/179 extracellular domain-containing protein n=2 Tax=Tetranychus urticae TaxID=32264 RepID=T1JXN6_TETUR
MGVAMIKLRSCVMFSGIIFLLTVIRLTNCQFDWQSRDNFDAINEQVNRVNRDNCRIVDINDLFLPNSTVTHVPNIKWLGTDPVFPNRTNLLHVHNMALSRAFFYSFILQKAEDDVEPGFMYYFLSSIADVAANRFINASSVYFAPDRAFTPSYKGFFNKTMPLFAPRAFRADDFNDPYHLSGTSTLNTIAVSDLGAVKVNSQSNNYTHEHYKINKWYNLWLPDNTKSHDSKTTYTAKIFHANGFNETFTFHGPPHASDTPGPVAWTQPYYDCERSNKWVVSATSPIVDFNPRHTGWRHIEYARYVAVSVMEIDFERLDINQCPIGPGNPRPNAFAGTSRCRNESTECEPIHGFGFRRGGYQCRCKSGFRLPKNVRTPYLGEIIERATTNEYKKGYSCEKIGYLAVRTQNAEVMDTFHAKILLGTLKTLTGLGKNTSERLDANTFTDFVRHNVTPDNCEYFLRTSPDKLYLPGNVAYDKEKQFENQARMALRLANFISAFLQVVDPTVSYAEFRVPDKSLTTDQMIGEVLSLVSGDLKLLGAGVFFDRNQFNANYTYFAPYAWRPRRELRAFNVIDLAGKRSAGPSSEPDYLKNEAFKYLKLRWTGITDQLQTYTTKINIRYNSSGLNTIKFDQYPLQYQAAELNHGYWSRPYYDCNGFHKRWLVTYSSPFFGWNNLRNKLVFKGVVSVHMDLLQLDINQCDSYGNTANAFEGTHKCDRESTRCVPMFGRKYESGGYKCECNQGYEYPYLDLVTYVDGQNLESEYLSVEKNKPSRMDQLRCRISGSSQLSIHHINLLLSLLSIIFFKIQFF